MSNLAMIHHRNDDLEEAQKLMATVTKAALVAFGLEHPTTLSLMCNLVTA